MGKVDQPALLFSTGVPRQTVGQAVGQAVARTLASSERRYRMQRTYVAVMFELIGRLLEASSRTDPEVRREVAGFPEGYIVGFSLLDGPLGMRLQKRGAALVRIDAHEKATLDITFKHVSHAFAVLSFQESTAQAFANDRAITQGDIALAMRFVRILNRMQAVALPSPVAQRALKAPLPLLTVGERARLTAQLYGQVVRGLRISKRDTP